MVGELKAPWNSFVFVLKSDLVEKFPNLPKQLTDSVVVAGKMFKRMQEAPDQIAARYGIDGQDARKWFEEVGYYEGEEFKSAIRTTAEILFRYRITDRVEDISNLVFD